MNGKNIVKAVSINKAPTTSRQKSQIRNKIAAKITEHENKTPKYIP